MSQSSKFDAAAFDSVPHHMRHAMHALVCTGDMLCTLCYAQYLLAKTVAYLVG